MDRVAPDARDVIEIQRWIGARPETVFSYFTDPEKFHLWQGEDASIELLAVVAPHSVVFTWGRNGIDGGDPGPAALLEEPSTVEILLEPRGAGTLLRLRQRIRVQTDPQGITA